MFILNKAGYLLSKGREVNPILFETSGLECNDDWYILSGEYVQHLLTLFQQNKINVSFLETVHLIARNPLSAFQYLKIKSCLTSFLELLRAEFGACGIFIILYHN